MTGGGARSARGAGAWAAALAVLLSACAGAAPRSSAPVLASGGAPSPAAGAGEASTYVARTRLYALADAVPPPPVAGSPRDLDDRARSDAYRVLAGGDRWLLAAAHAELAPELARQHFDCALGVRFLSTPTPRLTAVLGRVLQDADAAAERVKARAHRPRPVAADPDRAACQRVSAAGRASASYPSGAAAVAGAYGEVMAALDPSHAARSREIAREIGVSRVVCGMHYDTDVRAGEELGRAVGGEIVASPAFAGDLAVARAELAAVRATGLTNPGCVAEAAALATPQVKPLPRPAGG